MREFETQSERQLFEFDPYAAIRPALSPEHATLPANELTVILGHMPASLALHQLLNSPEIQQATAATILGGAARRSVRVNGLDVSIPAYLRMVSRLCGEVAEQTEAPHAAAHPPAHPAPPTEVAAWPLGVDLFQSNDVDAAGFRNLKRRGKTFGIAKTSQGTHPDGRFKDYYKWIRESGMIRGSFHFFANKRGTSPEPAWTAGTVEHQAKLVISMVKRLAPGDLAPALDLEDEGKGAAHRYPLDQGALPNERGYSYRKGHYHNWQAGRDELLEDIQDFLNRVETALGRTPIIYTSNMWTDSDMMDNPKTMSEYPLWAVWHGGAVADLSAGGWGRAWHFVQYAEQSDTTRWRGLLPYKEAGIDIPGLDFDAYQGTIYGLRGLADLGRPGVGFIGNTCYVAQSDADESLHLLTGTPWTDRNLTMLNSQRDLSGSDPVLLASLAGLFLYYRKGDHLIEALASASKPDTWQTAQIEDVQAPVHDPRAVLNGTKRHVVYCGADDDWHLLNWDRGWSSAGAVLSAAGIKTSATQGQATGQPMVYVRNGVAHMAGRVGPDGHLYDVWFEGTRWRSDDLTALGRTSVAALPAATYSPCAYETSGGVGIVFRAVGGNLWAIDRASHAPTNITSAAQAKTAAGHPACFVVNDEPHIVYRGSDKLIYDLSRRGGNWGWQAVCTEKAAADPVAVSSGAIGLAAVRAMDGGIRFARFDGAIWTCTATR